MNPFDELNELVENMFTYTPKTEEQLIATDVDDIIEWATEISSEWNGDESGSQEDRAHQADEIMQKANELIELIEGMKEL